MGLHRYREVLSTPSIGWLLGTSLMGRLPNGMTALGLLLLVTQHGSYAVAGAVSAAHLAAVCVATPLLARAADTYGSRRVLAISAVGYAGATVLLAAVAQWRLPLFLAAVLAGASTPPIAASARAVWPVLLPAEQRQAMFALEATLQELTFIAGPALVALLAAVAGPSVAMIGCGVLGLLGTLAFVASPAADAGVRSRSRRRPATVLRSAGLRRLVVAGAGLIAALSVAEISVVAFVSGQRASTGAAALLAVWSAGSLVGGMIFGARAASSAPLPAFFAVTAVGLGALALAPNPVSLGVLLFLGGATVAPTLARLYDRVGSIAPSGAGTETFGWLSTGLMAGAAAGAAAGGLTVSAYGPRVAFGLAAALGLLAGAAAEPLAVHRRSGPLRQPKKTSASA